MIIIVSLLVLIFVAAVIWVVAIHEQGHDILKFYPANSSIIPRWSRCVGSGTCRRPLKPGETLDGDGSEIL